MIKSTTCLFVFLIHIWRNPAVATGGVPTKQKWDDVKMAKHLSLERACWLKSPEVHVYGKKCKNPNSMMMLHCMATGFYPKKVTLNIRRNEQVVDELNGTVLPNGDNTFQIKKHVEILRSDSAKYSCEVIHPASRMNQTKDWDGVCDKSDNSGTNIKAIVGAVVAVLLVGVSVAAVILLYEEKKRQGGERDSLTPSENGNSGSNYSSGDYAPSENGNSGSNYSSGDYVVSIV